MRLIDADALIKDVDGDLHDFVAEIVAIEKIRAQPTVEVIRCKECKWYGEPGCAIRIVDDTDKPSDTDFCSFAERKEGEQCD